MGQAPLTLGQSYSCPGVGVGVGVGCPLHMAIPAPLSLEGGKGARKIAPPSKLRKLNQRWAQAHAASRGHWSLNQGQSTGLPNTVSTQGTARPRCSTRGFCFPSPRVRADRRPHP